MDPTEALTADFPWGSVDLEQAIWNMTHSRTDIVRSCTDFYNGPCGEWLGLPCDATAPASSHKYRVSGKKVYPRNVK